MWRMFGKSQGTKSGDFQEICVMGELVVWSQSLRSSISNDGGKRETRS
jgi:hypothetical protein